MSERIILCVEYTYHTISVLNCWNLYIYIFNQSALFEENYMVTFYVSSSFRI